MIDDLPAPSEKASLAELISAWRGRDEADWSRSSIAYQSLGEKMLAQGEPLLAYDVVTEALAKWPADVRLRQLQGLALARSGATERANAVLETLRQEGESDEETLGMLARTYKDLAAGSTALEQRQKALRRAAEIYALAYEYSSGIWSGVNAATTSLLVGQTERATRLANQVQKQCHEALSREGDRYWLFAALGEAALILRNWTEAKEWYQRAAQLAGGRLGDLVSTRRNGRLILHHWKTDSIDIDNYLHVPAVIVFSGHMIDSPGRVRPRFPASLEPDVAKAISNRIGSLKPGIGFSSAACGSDILFLEAMHNTGAKTYVVLPYNRDQFIRDSVDFLPNSNWRVRFERIVQQATQVVIASNEKLDSGSVSLEFTNELLLGLATLYAARMETHLVPLAVWDGMSGDGAGGTAAAVRNWKRLGHKPEVIKLAEFCPRTSAGRTQALRDRDDDNPHSGADDSKRFNARIVAILFADAVGFSKLSEQEVPRFVEHFLRPIGQLSSTLGEQIIAKNTWGDGLYFVFSDVHAAGRFALEVADLVSTTCWEDKGLPGGLSLRIALHAGPVYEFDDPITGNRSYSGTHVSRAARMEPITPANQVYASEAFAALAAGQGAGGFICDYVGQTALAKSYGTLPMYHLRRGTTGVRL